MLLQPARYSNTDRFTPTIVQAQPHCLYPRSTAGRGVPVKQIRLCSAGCRLHSLEPWPPCPPGSLSDRSGSQDEIWGGENEEHVLHKCLHCLSVSSPINAKTPTLVYKELLALVSVYSSKSLLIYEPERLLLFQFTIKWLHQSKYKQPVFVFLKYSYFILLCI